MNAIVKATLLVSGMSHIATAASTDAFGELDGAGLDYVAPTTEMSPVYEDNIVPFEPQDRFLGTITAVMTTVTAGIELFQAGKDLWDSFQQDEAPAANLSSGKCDRFMLYNKERQVCLQFNGSSVTYSKKCATPSPDQTFTASAAEGGFQLWNVGTGKCLVDYEKNGVGLGTLDYGYKIYDDQIWYLEPHSDGYLLINKYHGNRLVMYGDSRGLGVLASKYAVYSDQVWSTIC